MTHIARSALFVAALLLLVAPLALATPENTGLNENFFNLSSGVISEGGSISASSQFSLSNPNSSGGAGTTTRTLNGNTVTYVASGSAQGSSAASAGGGGTSQTFNGGSLTYYTPGVYSVSIGGSLSWHSTENSSYGLGQGNGDAGLGYADNRLVTVLNVAPQSPTLSLASTVINQSGSNISANMSASDPGNDTLTFTASGNATNSIVASGQTTPGSTRSVSGINIGAYSTPGVYTVTGTAQDNFGGSSSAPNVLLTVLNVAPSSVTLSAATINEGSAASANMSATDPGSDTLTFTASGNATNSIAATGQNTPGSTRSVSGIGVGTYNTPGVYTVTGSVNDGFGGNTNAPSALLTVLNVAPQSATLSLSSNVINEGQHDFATETATDPGADTLTFNVNGHIVTDPNTTPGSLRTSGSVDLGAYNTPGVYTITGSVSDNFGGSATAVSQLLTVLNVAPTITGLNLSSHTIFEGQSISASMTATDPGTGAITFTINGNPAGTDNTNVGAGDTRVSNTVNLGPFYNSGPSSTVTITGTASDGSATTNTSDTITVLNVAPVITNIVATTLPNPGGGFAPMFFTATAFDPGTGNTEVLTYLWDPNGGTNYTFAGNPSPVFNYVTGTHTITVQVSDGNGGVGTGSLTFTVVPEPATWAVIALSGGTLAFVARWRRRRK